MGIKVNELFKLVEIKKDLWLDLTEECYMRNLYRKPADFTVTRNEQEYSYSPTGNPYVNDRVIDLMAVECNHLIDYVKAAMERNRDTYVEKITELISDYEAFLDKFMKRDENGKYYINQRR